MTTYYGPTVAYGNGGWFRSVLDVWDSGATTGAAVTVGYQYGVQFNVSISDSNNSVAWIDPWGSGNANNTAFSFGSGGGQRTVSGPNYASAGIVYGAQNQLRFLMSSSGLANSSGTSSIDIWYALPGRSGMPPAAPVVAYNQLTATTVQIFTASAGPDNGASADVVNYRLQRASDGAIHGDIQGSYAGVTFVGLTPNTGYVCFVQSHNAFGWGAWSAGVGFTTPSGVPGQPGLTVDSITATSARAVVTAAAPNGAGVDLYEALLRTAGQPDRVQTGGTTTFAGMTRGTTYEMWARARNSLGWGNYAGPVTFTTPALVPTINPVYAVQTLTRNSATITNLAVFDTGGAALDNVRVQYNTSASTSGALVYTRGSWGNPTITGLTDLTLYYYRLAPHNSAGWGAYPVTWKSFTTLDDAPSDMAAPTFSSVTDTSMRVNWVAPAMNGATFSSYRYELSLSPTFDVLARSGTTAALFIDITGLALGTRYYARVRVNATPSNGGYGTANQMTTGIAINSGLRVYASVPSVGIRLCTMYATVGGSIREIRPMWHNGAGVQTE